MARIHLIHWRVAESKQLAEKLTSLGHTVNNLVPINQQFFKNLRANPPEIMVIDLSRLPSQGRDIGVNLRTHKSTLHIPLIFVGGDPVKVTKNKEILPDAIYCNWDEIETCLHHAINNPPEARPISNVFAGYSGKPLIRKLGIKTDMIVCLLNPPNNFIKKLGELPDGVKFITDLQSPSNIILWFVYQAFELKSTIPAISQTCKEQQTRVWICWQKKSAGKKSDVTQPIVRQVGLEHGLVDYKICAIDKTWSGLLFTSQG